MSSVWREYGAIAILLVIAVGGYLYLSRSEEDLVSNALQQISEQLLALVPEGEGREQTRESLNEMEAKLELGEIQPEQIELLAANVLNLRSSGQQLDPEEAEMVMKMTMEEPDALPTPESMPQQVVAKPPASRATLVETAKRVDYMFKLFNDIQSVAPPDSLVEDVPAVRFYAADGGLRAEVDDRLRTKIRTAEREYEGALIAYRSKLAESLRDHSVELDLEAKKMASLFSDTTHVMPEMRSLELMKRLESRGFMFHPEIESLAVHIESQIVTQLGAAGVQIGTAVSGATEATSSTRSTARAGSSSNR